MVNPSILVGALPLAGIASALYLPHEEDSNYIRISGNTPAAVANDKAQGHSASQLLDDRKKPCAKKAGKSHHGKKHHSKEHHSKELNGKHHGKHHGKEHHGKEHHGEHHGEDKAVKPTEHSVLIQNADGVYLQSEPELNIPDKYIVILKKGVEFTNALADLSEFSAQAAAEHTAAGNPRHPLLDLPDKFEVSHIYDKLSFSGYAARMLPQAARLLAQSPFVEHIEADSVVHALNTKEEDQAPWGLARVSHRDHLGLGTYNKYLYDNHAGEGVTSYIVDTGIYIDHEDFEGRARWGKTMPVGDTDTDAHGHGSHCAGTIGGKRYGVAKKANLVAVKVLGSDGSGSMSDVIGGVEFVVESHRKEKDENPDFKGSTANMSLGGGKSPALDIAVNAATEAGVHFAVAAGNENQDACNTSPAAAEGAVTVGATDVRDDRAYFSNWGKCVDIFAPGVNVLSVGTYSPSSTAVMSGTSMASPHIAGLLTYFLSLQPSTDSLYSTRGSISTKELKKLLIEYGTTGAINDLDADSPNVLAYNGGGEDLSGFWTGSKDTEKKKTHHSFLETVEDLVENIAETVEESINRII